MNPTAITNQIEFSGWQFAVSRPHAFGAVIDGPAEGASDDYLHDVLLSEENRVAFLNWIDAEGLVVCKNVQTTAPTYRKVRGKSSHGRLSQAEYYHHDGCSCPVKPRVVEIRLPHQLIERNVHTAVARFPDVIRAMLQALPERLRAEGEVADWVAAFTRAAEDLPDTATWDKIQGRLTRMVRREFDAESSRAYFRDVDRLADAYVLPWEMGESRLMANNMSDLALSMQHRRAYQKPRVANEQNGSLVKRWTAEEG